MLYGEREGVRWWRCPERGFEDRMMGFWQWEPGKEARKRVDKKKRTRLCEKFPNLEWFFIWWAKEAGEGDFTVPDVAHFWRLR